MTPSALPNETTSSEETKEAGRQNSIASRRFPYPTEVDRSHLVIFDGRCVFCTAQIRSIYRLDFLRKLTFISLHDPKIAEWFPDLSYEELMKQIYVIPNFSMDTDHRKLKKLEADKGIRFLALRNLLFLPIGILLSIPFTQPLWNYLYHQVAKRRYYFGKVKPGSEGQSCEEGGTCHLHFGDTKDKEK